jgi:hypothetical protein
MATLQDLAVELGDVSNAASALMLQAEPMLTQFPFQAPNKFMAYEMLTYSDIMLTGDSTRQLNTGYSTVSASGRGFTSFPLMLYGGSQQDEAQYVDAKPDIQVTKRIHLTKKAGRSFIDDLFHQSSSTNPKSVANLTSLNEFASFNGRSELMATNGAPLSLSRLSRALLEVPSNGTDVKIFMSELMKPLLSGLASNQNISGNINILPGDFGKPLYYFNGIEIVFTGRRFDKHFRLGFNETTGTNTETSSVYIVATGTEDVFGLFGTPRLYKSPEPVIVTTPDGKKMPAYEELLDIPMGIGYGSPECVWRIGGISNAAIVS